MKQLRVNRKQEGYSLIEVVICLFMIAVLLVLYASALNIVAITRKLRYENVAYHIANKQMEALRGISYADLPASGTISDSLLSEIPTGAGNFTVASYPAHNNMKEIIVTVTWTDPVSKQIVLKTLTGLGGINP
jgi:prepilin-type N-terminal cleavage/methylation domain-containing protein